MMPPERYIATAPSNIAFLKYWGKDDPTTQWPCNDSLSMTLTNCVTETAVTIGGEHDRFSLSGTTIDLADSSLALSKKVQRLKELLGIENPLQITSRNTFPTGCGIASSASGMAALVLATAAAKTGAHNLKDLAEHGYDRLRLSHLARLLSGSAARSFWGGYVLWQKGFEAQAHFAGPLSTEWPLCDTVMVIDSQPKATSSSAGHHLASSSPLFPIRLTELPERLKAMQAAIANHDIHTLGPLIEAEALNMHAVMLSSQPRLNYLSESTIAAICWLRQIRSEEKLPVYFTIDAGPNLHLIYEPEYRASLSALIHRDWPDLLTIHDQVGAGPTLQVIHNSNTQGDVFGSHSATL